MRIVTVVGARPQFVKAAPVSRALREWHEEILVHTGQHYDHGMSGAFFDELGIPAPAHSLAVGSGSHGTQTGRMLEAIERVLVAERPDAVLVYGDTNSTLAGALAAAKLHIPVVHVEAGLRSFDMRMPEEVNRVLTDRVSSLLLCPSQVAVNHLASEGIVRGVHEVGDVMLDALLAARQKVDEGEVLSRLDLWAHQYALATVHRAENTDSVSRLDAILAALGALDVPVLFPVHPRTRHVLEQRSARVPPNVTMCEPLGYLDLVAVLSQAAFVLTDSGGLQKEAYWLQVPCITLRDTTEWEETVASGWNQLVGTTTSRIVEAARNVARPLRHDAVYGTPGASGRVVRAFEQLDVRRARAA